MFGISDELHFSFHVLLIYTEHCMNDRLLQKEKPLDFGFKSVTQEMPIMMKNILAVFVYLSVCLSVCHTPVLYQNV